MQQIGFEAHCLKAIEETDPAAWLCEMFLPHMNDMAELAGLDAIPADLWPTWADSRVDAIVSMAGDAFFFGQDGLSKIDIPVMAIGGTADKDSPFTWGTHPTYEYAASRAKVEIALHDAEHMIFTGECESIPWYLKFFSGEFCSDPIWNRGYAHALTKHFTTAFLLAELRQDQKAVSALSLQRVDFVDVNYKATGY